MNSPNIFMTNIQFFQIFIIGFFFIFSILVVQYFLHYINISESCNNGTIIPSSNKSLLNSSLGIILTLFTIAMFASSFQLYESGSNSTTIGIMMVSIFVVFLLSFYLYKFNNIKKTFDEKVITNPMDVFK